MKRKVIGALGSVCVAVAAHAAVPEKIPVVVFEDVFDPGASHVQGACCSDDAVYLTQRTALYKFGWDGKRLFIAFYAVKGSPAVVVTDTDWNILQKVSGFTASNGLDLLPARLRGDKLRFFKVTTSSPPRRDNPSKKGIGASLTFYEFKDGSFIDITQ